MIQCTNAHIRRLLSEKQTHEEELQKMKEKFKNIFEGILRQCKCCLSFCLVHGFGQSVVREKEKIVIAG